ncbi:substrate-binding domain-containing protein [Haloferula sp. A504]|uniref:substrate-binding domain-containing protein n=1 Tax=Haloferula sp. A504 TaxID=3373601 RepID=UPI0031BD2764|nr:substrate-binding domain-containing protein [Verrucomicrobiaceae bacterium E54]
MSELTILSPSEQVAAHLREELLRGRWGETMPGGPSLAAALGIDKKTVEAALGLLEEERLLVRQGPGRRRRIELPANVAPPSLRLAILNYEPLAQVEAKVFLLKQKLIDEGHTAFFAERSQMELRFDVPRIARLVAQTPADAWIVHSGSRDVLAWFAERETPVFAMFGRRRTLPIAGAGPDHPAACREAVRRLIELGHRRIVVLARESQRAGGPGAAERAIFEEMESHGVPTGSYNLPDWEDSAEDLRRVLDELFRVTPPTALIIDEPFLFHAVKEHLERRGVGIPEQVSVICSEPDPTFAWLTPSVAHISHDGDLIERRILRWANSIARGRDDRRQTLTKAEFVDGGTIGPANPRQV